MKLIFFLFLISLNLFSEEFLKVIILDEEKNFIMEKDEGGSINLNDLDVKEGYIIYYPDGEPPLCYKFKDNKFEKIYKEENLKEFFLILRDCEFGKEIKGKIKIFPEKKPIDFPFEKKYYYILLENSKKVLAKEGNYFIEELYGNYFSPTATKLETLFGILLYPSFKTKVIIKNQEGEVLQNCKLIEDFEIFSYGKVCERVSYKRLLEGNDFFQVFPFQANAKFKVFCPKSSPFSFELKTEQIPDPFVINLKKLGKIEGYLLDENGNPISNYQLNLFKEGELVSLKTAITNRDGYFNFSNLEDGVYKIKDCKGFELKKGKNFLLRVRDDLIFNEDYGSLSIMVKDEPQGDNVEERVTITGGEDVFLNLFIPNENFWEGYILNKRNEPIKGASIFSNFRLISKTDEEGKFEVPFRGEFLKKVEIKAEGYESKYYDFLQFEEAPKEIILNGIGTFKASIFLEKKEKENLLPKILEYIKFINEDEKEVRGESKLIVSSGRFYLISNLPEGKYYFVIGGGPFLDFTSEAFYIEANKEYDYGEINLQILEGKNFKPREVVIKFKDYKDFPAPDIRVTILARSFENPELTFSSNFITDKEGKIIFKPDFSNFLFVFLYAEGERGFAKLDMEEISDLSNLNYFEIKLNPPNEISIQISSFIAKEGKFKVLIKGNYNYISDEILPGEEKVYKNLFSPQDVEIYDGPNLIWRETIILKAGRNEVHL